MKKIILKRKNLSNPQIKAYESAVEKGMNSQHVLSKDGAWIVKRVGAARISGIFNSQKEAINFGRKVAQEKQSELFVHSLSGRIKSRQSF